MNIREILPYLTNGLIALFLLLTVTPVKLNYSSMAIIALAVVALGAWFLLRRERSASNPLLFVVCLPLAIYLIGLLNTENLPEGISYLVRSASYLAFPFAFYVLGRWVNKKFVLNSYLIALSVTNVFLIYLFIYYFNFGARFYRVVSVDIYHSTYLGMYNLLAFWICIYAHRKNYGNLYLIFSAFFLVCALLPSSRMIFILGGLSIVVALFLLVGSATKRLGLAFLVALAISAIFIFTPSIRQKFQQITEMEEFGFVESNYKSVSSRFGKMEATAKVLRENWLTGTGTGDLMDVLSEEYRRMNFTMGYKYRYNPHNQYLDNLARNGIPGGVIALSAFYLFPIWVGFRRKHLLLIAFGFLVGGASLTESILDVHKGITFYAFFVSFLLLDALPERETTDQKL